MAKSKKRYTQHASYLDLIFERLVACGDVAMRQKNPSAALGAYANAAPLASVLDQQHAARHKRGGAYAAGGTSTVPSFGIEPESSSG